MASTTDDTDTGSEPGMRSGEGSASLLQLLSRDNFSKGRGSAHPEVFEAHERWENIHTTLREMETGLSHAVRLYAQGQGPVPEQLMAEVVQLRGQCSGLFAHLMEVVKRQAGKEV